MAATPSYLSLKQAAEQLGVSRSSVTGYLKAGKLAAVEIAGRRVVEAKAVEASSDRIRAPSTRRSVAMSRIRSPSTTTRKPRSSRSWKAADTEHP